MKDIIDKKLINLYNKNNERIKNDADNKNYYAGYNDALEDVFKILDEIEENKNKKSVSANSIVLISNEKVVGYERKDNSWKK